MTIKHTSQIICDNCDTTMPVVIGKADDARLVAEVEGWKRQRPVDATREVDSEGWVRYFQIIQRGDFCPACVEEGDALYAKAKRKLEKELRHAS